MWTRNLGSLDHTFSGCLLGKRCVKFLTLLLSFLQEKTEVEGTLFVYSRWEWDTCICFVCNTVLYACYMCWCIHFEWLPNPPCPWTCHSKVKQLITMHCGALAEMLRAPACFLCVAVHCGKACSNVSEWALKKTKQKTKKKALVGFKKTPVKNRKSILAFPNSPLSVSRADHSYSSCVFCIACIHGLTGVTTTDLNICSTSSKLVTLKPIFLFIKIVILACSVQYCTEWSLISCSWVSHQLSAFFLWVPS